MSGGPLFLLTRGVSILDFDICGFSSLDSTGVSFFSFFSDLVVASAGDDKKISLWRKNGQSMGTIPIAGNDSGDNIEVSWLFSALASYFV